MENNERVAIEADCARLFSEFCWYIDAFDYDRAIALFVPHCTFRRVKEVFEGADGLRAVLERRDKNRTTLHLCNNTVIEVADRNTATGRAYMTIFGYRGELREGEDAPLSVPDSIVRNDATFTRTDDGWRFASLALGLLFRKPDSGASS